MCLTREICVDMNALIPCGRCKSKIFIPTTILSPVFDRKESNARVQKVRKPTFEPTPLGPNRLLRYRIRIHRSNCTPENRAQRVAASFVRSETKSKFSG